MSNIGFGELLLLFFVFLMFFGAKKLPGMARSLGRTVEQFRRAATDVREEFLRADQEDKPTPHYDPPSSPETYGYPSSVVPNEPATDGSSAPAAETPAMDEGRDRPSAPDSTPTAVPVDHPVISAESPAASAADERPSGEAAR